MKGRKPFRTRLRAAFVAAAAFFTIGTGTAVYDLNKAPPPSPQTLTIPSTPLDLSGLFGTVSFPQPGAPSDVTITVTPSDDGTTVTPNPGTTAPDTGSDFDFGID